MLDSLSVISIVNKVNSSSAHLWFMSNIIDIVKPSINLPSQLLHAALHREESYERDRGKLFLRAGVNKRGPGVNKIEIEYGHQRPHLAN